MHKYTVLDISGVQNVHTYGQKPSKPEPTMFEDIENKELANRNV